LWLVIPNLFDLSKKKKKPTNFVDCHVKNIPTKKQPIEHFEKKKSEKSVAGQ
jgi:hypothetical protein